MNYEKFAVNYEKFAVICRIGCYDDAIVLKMTMVLFGIIVFYRVFYIIYLYKTNSYGYYEKFAVIFLLKNN